jgi:septum formation protein
MYFSVSYTLTTGILLYTLKSLDLTRTTLAFTLILPNKIGFEGVIDRLSGTFIQLQSQQQTKRSKNRTRKSLPLVMSASAPATSTGADPELVLSVKDHLQQIGCIDDQQNVTMKSLVFKIRLVLASQSPRRKEILDMMGLENLYEIIPSPVDETEIQNQLRRSASRTENTTGKSDVVVDPVIYARTLAEQKALSVAREISLNDSVRQPHLILGSDTIVVMRDDSNATTTILEKPTDTDDARKMLRHIQGQSHTVFTGVAIVLVLPTANRETHPPDGSDPVAERVKILQSFVETAQVNIGRMSETDIERYVRTSEPMDKAGAYGIQGIGGQIVSSIQGDFFTVRC